MRQLTLSDRLGAINCCSDVSDHATIDDVRLHRYEHPNGFTSGRAELKLHIELATVTAVLTPLPFTLCTSMRSGIHPRSGPWNNRAARQAQRSECVVAASESTIGIGFKDSDGKSGGCGVNTSSFTDCSPKAVEQTRTVTPSA